jgi:hypothetical protein
LPVLAEVIEFSAGLLNSVSKEIDVSKLPIFQNDTGVAALLGPALKKLKDAIDRIPGDAKKLADAAGTLNLPGANQSDIQTKLDIVKTVLPVFSSQGAVAEAVDAASEIGRAITRGDLSRLIDVDAPRRQIEQLIQDLVPHKVTLSYSLDNEVRQVKNIFLPAETGGKRLVINTKAEIDLLRGGEPTTSIKGRLDPFNIKLLGDEVDVVTLKFKTATFEGGRDKPFRLNLDIDDVQLGKAVEFIQQLQSYLVPADGNGFYIKPASGGPGLDVGYGLNLGTISLGPVSFINVSLNAGCRLPFDKRSALFMISLSRADAPFLISAGIYGGGGYLSLISGKSSGSGGDFAIVGFESSFEFGGVSAFSFGPLTGIGRLTTGIFIRKLYDSTTIEGFFFVGGSARVACFGVAASLSVRISQQPGGAMAGQAVFTFCFSIGLAHFDYHVAVWKTQPALGGGAAELEVPQLTRYAGAKAHMNDGEIAGARSPQQARGRIHVKTYSPERDWDQYQEYFDQDLKPPGK